MLAIVSRSRKEAAKLRRTISVLVWCVHSSEKKKKHTILRNTNFSELRTAKLKVKFHFKNDILAIYSIMMTHIAN